jgi:hypothetical protein
MAEQTLFGSYNPQLIQQAIEAERERGLLEQAKLTPQQIINLGAARSGQQMGQALGGVVNTLFGLPSVQDPRLQQAQLGQQAYQEALQASGNDASSPAFFKQLSSSAARLGVTTLAQQAAVQAAKLESEQALGVQRIASAQASLAQAAKERAPEAPLTIADRTRLNELVQKFGTTEGARKFREERDEAARKTAAAGAPPKAFGADINLRESFLKEVKPIDEPLNALDKAQSLLNEQSGLADSIAKRQFAKFAGDRDISNKDVAAFGNFGPLGQRLSGIFSQFLQGTYSDAQREEAIRIITNLRNPLEQQRATIEQQFTGAATRQGITGDQASFVVPSRAKGVRQITTPSETGISNAITLPSGNKARPIQ